MQGVRGQAVAVFQRPTCEHVEQIAEQLEYREANRQKVAELNVTRTLGCDMKVMLDEDAKRFIVTRNSRWRDANPDVWTFPGHGLRYRDSRDAQRAYLERRRGPFAKLRPAAL